MTKQQSYPNIKVIIQSWQLHLEKKERERARESPRDNRGDSDTLLEAKENQIIEGHPRAEQYHCQTSKEGAIRLCLALRKKISMKEIPTLSHGHDLDPSTKLPFCKAVAKCYFNQSQPFLLHPWEHSSFTKSICQHERVPWSNTDNHLMGWLICFLQRQWNWTHSVNSV